MESENSEMLKLGTYLHKGIPLAENFVPRSRIMAVDNYKDIRSDDVIVCTYSKAGTHWAADIARKVLCDGDLLKAQERDIESYFEISPPSGINKGDDGYAVRSLEELSELPSPRVILTHLPLSMLPPAVLEKKAKVIYVYRDPRDIAVSFYSWAKYQLLVRGIDYEITWEQFFEDFTSGNVIFGSWQNHYKDFQENCHRADTLALKYEDMKKDLSSAVSTVALFLGKTLESDVITRIANSCTFESMKAQHKIKQLFRKGICGDWKNTFTVDQSERMTEIIAQAKKQLGLRIDYE